MIDILVPVLRVPTRIEPTPGAQAVFRRSTEPR